MKKAKDSKEYDAMFALQIVNAIGRRFEILQKKRMKNGG